MHACMHAKKSQNAPARARANGARNEIAAAAAGKNGDGGITRAMRNGKERCSHRRNYVLHPRNIRSLREKLAPSRDANPFVQNESQSESGDIIEHGACRVNAKIAMQRRLLHTKFEGPAQLLYYYVAWCFSSKY